MRRYGLDDRRPSTLRRLGEELGLSRERVKQMQLEAEQALRKGGQSGLLRGIVA